MTIKFYNQHVENFIEALEKPEIAKTLRTPDLLKNFKNKLGMPHCKRIDKNLFELRIRGRREIRLIYCFNKIKIIILYAFIKKTKKISPKILKIAKERIKTIEKV